MMRCPKDFPDSSVGKESTCKAGDPSSITWVRKIRWRKDRLPFPVFLGFPGDSAGKESACSAGDSGLIPGLGRSPGEGKGSVQFSSVAQLCPTLWFRGLQHARPPCPSPIPRVYSNSCPLSRWCHPTISSSVIPFSSRLHSFPASGSFQMSQFFASGGQSIGVSASASVLPMNTQDWSFLGWTGWISLPPKDSQESFPTPQFKSINSWCSAFIIVQFSHPYMTTGKTIVFTRRTFVDKVMSLLFNMLSRVVITFLPRSKHLLISWL